MPLKWTTPSAASQLLSTELVSLGSSTLSVVSGTIIDNSSQLNMFGDFQVDVTFPSGPASGGWVGIYCVPNLDGTNYASNNIAYTTNLLTNVPVTTSSAEQFIIARNLLLPPMLMKFSLYNGTSVAVAASSVATCTLKFITYDTAST